MPCERIAFAGKAVKQISHHRKDGVTEAWLESVVLNAGEEEREYRQDGSFMILVRTKNPSGANVTVNIYAREEVFKIDDRIIWRTCTVFGIHLEG